MRVLLVGFIGFGLAVLPAMAQVGNHCDGAESNAVQAKATSEPSVAATKDVDRLNTDAYVKGEPSSSGRGYSELLDLLHVQSDELRATREELHQLQRRLELLESELRPQSIARAPQGETVMPLAPEVPEGSGHSASATPDYVDSQLEKKNSSLPAETPVATLNDATLAQPAPPDPHSSNRAMARTVDQENKSDSIKLAHGKVTIGTLLYADYAYYIKTGFGPQFLSQINPPGPGNNGYNAFEISRAYINLFYSPSNAVTFRLTPDLYRQIGAAPGTKVGAVSAVAPSTDQELALRVKYAYVDFNDLFASSDAFKKDKLTIGQQQDALIEWEERLYGYRYTSLMPWDYLDGLGAAWAGVSLHGPIDFNRKQYLDYAIGVFNSGSYRQLEQSEKKQVMARLTVYPFGTRSNYDGLGFTGFYDFGYTNVAPDSGVNIPLYRIAALAHYTFDKNAFEIAGEFDAGRNVFTSGNFFSGSGPRDEFGLGTTQFAGFDALVQALQNGNGTKQRGYAVFGHAQIPRSRYTLFAMYQYFLPNTKVEKNPLDFSRIVAGVSYKVNDRLRFALTSQNLIFKYSQFTFPASELQLFSPSLAAAYPNGIPNAVPNPVQAIFANTEFTF